jgi:hypothetical protein
MHVDTDTRVCVRVRIYYYTQQCTHIHDIHNMMFTVHVHLVLHFDNDTF